MRKRITVLFGITPRRCRLVGYTPEMASRHNCSRWTGHGYAPPPASCPRALRAKAGGR